MIFIPASWQRIVIRLSGTADAHKDAIKLDTAPAASMATNG